MFLAFAYDDYYPLGACYDFGGSFSTFAEAVAAITKHRRERGDVYDIQAEQWTLVRKQEWGYGIVDEKTQSVEPLTISAS